MGFIYKQSGAWNFRMYASVSIATGNAIIADPENEGKPLRDAGGSLASRSLGKANVGQVRFRRLVDKKGKPVKIQQSIKLCDVNAEYPTEKCMAVIALARQLEERVAGWEKALAKSEDQPLRPDSTMLVTDFFENVFMPYIEKNKAPSTARSYRLYWSYLAEHFNHTARLRDYEAFQGSNLLDRMASEGYAENTIRGVRSLARNIFSYGIAKGYCKVNPWREAKKTVDKSGNIGEHEGYAHTLKEISAILAALDLKNFSERAKRGAEIAQVAVTIAKMGLRPSELCGLLWKNVDLDNGTLKVCEVYLCGAHKKTTKNKKIRVLQMFPDVLATLKLWAAHQREEFGELPRYVLANREGGPTIMESLSERFIKPAIEKVGLTMEDDKSQPLPWTFYAMRRGILTAMVDAGATLEEVANFAGNSTRVIEAHYFKDKKNTLAANAVAKLLAAPQATGSFFRPKQKQLAAATLEAR